MPSQETYNLFDLVQEYFPEVSESEASDILWSRTRFPFRAQGESLVAFVASLRESLAAAADADRRGVRQCDLCSKDAAPNDSCCPDCRSFLRAAQTADILMK